MKTSLLIKILLPVLIIAAIGGMWFVKNNPKNIAIEVTDSTVASLDGADFGLEATEAVDFAKLAEYGLPVIVDLLIPAARVYKWLPH